MYLRRAAREREARRLGYQTVSLLPDGTQIDDLVEKIELPGKQALSIDLTFADLIIVWIGPKPCF